MDNKFHVPTLYINNLFIATTDAGRFMNHIKMGYSPTDLENVSLIKQSLVFPESPVNILDPCCGCDFNAFRLLYT